MTVSAQDVRDQQVAHEQLGSLFAALHGFTDFLLSTVWAEEELPYPILSVNKDRLSRRGSYKPLDGTLLAHTINVNPDACRTGNDAAEVVAHELVHLWQFVDGQPFVDNRHSSTFHDTMLARYGITTRGRNGFHIDVSDKWRSILAAADPEGVLGQFVLPGMHAKPARRMLKHACPECGASFSSRQTEPFAVCMACDLAMEPQP